MQHRSYHTPYHHRRNITQTQYHTRLISLNQYPPDQYPHRLNILDAISPQTQYPPQMQYPPQTQQPYQQTSYQTMPFNILFHHIM